MNIIKMGELYSIYDDGINVSKKLEPGAYEVIFIGMKGFFLKGVKKPVVQEQKIYGALPGRLEKVFNSYELSKKNLGVILSGDKGIGKSLFAKLLALKAIEKKLPVIYVNTYYDGIANFLSDIDQRCVVVFDEFDKNFYSQSNECKDGTCLQDSFLTLFDGLYASSKLFVVTANQLTHLSDYLVNRPGRFRYHIRFEYPQADEIREFMRDKLGKAYSKKEVEAVVKFSTIVPLSFDCLAAIATEFQLGETFESALEILNIINVMTGHYYSGTLVFTDGTECRLDYVGHRNFFDKTEDSKYLNQDVQCGSGFVRDDLAQISMRQGDVRKCGRFLQDGTIVIPYNGGKNFKYKCKNLDHGRKNPINGLTVKELVLSAESGFNGNVSFSKVL